MMPILGALVASRRESIAASGDSQKSLTPNEALDVLNGAVSMWSYLSYRRSNRMGGNHLPAEVALLHRSMSGVRMSLLRIFIHGDSHTFSDIKGWQNDPFNASTWTGAVEDSGLLVTDDGEGRTDLEVCVASTKMIAKVLSTIVEYSPGSPQVIDMQDAYGVSGEILLNYGHAYFQLEQARIGKSRLIAGAFNTVRDDLIQASSVLSRPGSVDKVWREHRDRIRIETKHYDNIINDGFTRAIKLLGYDPEKFRSVKSAI